MREKDRKATNYHRSQNNQISALLNIDPTAWNKLKEVCKKFKTVTGVRVALKERAGDSVKHVAEADPLREKGFGRAAKLFPCTRGGGKWDKNGAKG